MRSSPKANASERKGRERDSVPAVHATGLAESIELEVQKEMRTEQI